jgi:amidase
VKPLHELGAAEAVGLLSRGAISAEELVRALLARIDAEDGRIGAFEHLDREAALGAARAADARRPRPLLAGLPVAVKDIIDTAGLPTERGSEIFRGRVPERDAWCVRRLRAAGAVVLGKTVTTELAFFRPGKTRNPHDPARTPGGSSSGSAAAVAARLAPLALGTQTAGSVVRPASFCGVVGYKPAFGEVPMDGISPFAPSLDTLGFFARDLAAIPLVQEALASPVPAARGSGTPRFALCRTESWPRADPATRALVEETAARLAGAGAAVAEADLPPAFAGLADAQRTIMAVEAARTWGALRDREGERLSPVLRDLLAEGEAVAPAREAEARAQAERCRALLPEVFGPADALLTPSAIGEAPEGLGATGDPAFNRIWTLLGTPCLSLPAGRGPAGMPIGIQLVGRAGAEGDFLRAARFAADALALPD